MSQLLHKFLWFCRKKHMQDLVWWVITYLCHARTFPSPFCNTLLSFKGVRAQAAQLSPHYGSGCVTPDAWDPSWPCCSYQWASCGKLQGFGHTGTLSGPSQVSFHLSTFHWSCKSSLFSVPQVQLFCPPSVLHQQINRSAVLVVSTPGGSGTTRLCKSATVFLLSYLLLFYFWPWLLQTYLQYTPSLSPEWWQ